ncbi:MAG: hypothetical protein ABWZ63_07340 [Thermoleophilaceae bacterium]
MPRLALPGREILIQRRTNDRMNEPQALDGGEDVSPDEVIRRRTGGVFAQTRHAPGELRLAVIPKHGDRPRQLARRRAERGKSMQNKAAHGGRTDLLHLARRAGRRHDPRRVQGAEQLPQEQGVATGGSMTRAAELLSRLCAQALPRQSHGSGLAQWSRMQHARLGTRRHLSPQRPPVGR